MIVFLTLIYVLILSLLVKFKVLQLNLFWKLSPILWMLILFIFLFVPLQWGAPAGNVRVYQTVVEVIPNVAGEVIEVPVQGMQPLKKDDVLFRIDPEPYQFQLDAARSALEDAKQKVEQLKAAADSADAAVEKTLQGIDLMKAEEQNALANIVAAEATVEEALAKKKSHKAITPEILKCLSENM